MTEIDPDIDRFGSAARRKAAEIRRDYGNPPKCFAANPQNSAGTYISS